MRIGYKSSRINLNGKEDWETDVDRRIILKYSIKEMRQKDVECIHLSQDRKKWSVFENTVMSIWTRK
jgi:hypothetical protein